MAQLVQALLRIIALVFIIIITGLIGNVIASNNNARSSATRAINFTMFVAAWSWVTALYGLAASIITSLAISFILLPLEILAVLFTFIDAIVLSAKLRAIDCSDISSQSLPRSWIAFGSSNNEKRCREIQTSLVFMWFLFAVFSVCLFFSFTTLRGGLSFGRKKGAAPSRPMTQV